MEESMPWTFDLKSRSRWTTYVGYFSAAFHLFHFLSLPLFLFPIFISLVCPYWSVLTVFAIFLTAVTKAAEGRRASVGSQFRELKSILMRKARWWVREPAGHTASAQKQREIDASTQFVCPGVCLPGHSLSHQIDGQDQSLKSCYMGDLKWSMEREFIPVNWQIYKLELLLSQKV